MRPYITQSCSMVFSAKILLDSFGVSYVTFDIDEDSDAGQRLYDLTQASRAIESY